MEEKYMLEAIEEAKKAAALLETPVGAVIVCDGVIVGRGYNTRETDKNALCHAEIKAIDEACRTLGGWRLLKCDMYVTLEPCPMCMGAIISARIERVYFGAYDQKSGACGSACDVSQSLPHKVIVTGGIMEQECAGLLREFFRGLRTKKKEK